MDWKKKQRLISLIPFVSTIIIFFVTIYNFKRENASYRKWFLFNLIWFATGITLCIVDAFFKTSNLSHLQTAIMWLILVISNFGFINIQIATNVVTEKKKAQIPSIQKKIVFSILIIGVILSILIGCLFMMDGSQGYTDNNGASDTSLCSIKIDEILNTSNNFSATLVSDSYTGGKTQVKGELEYADYDNVVFACKRIDGIITLQATKVTDDTITIVVDSSVKTGNAEILILVDDKYYCNVDTNRIQSIELSNISEKTIVVRMATESAEVNVNVIRSIK